MVKKYLVCFNNLPQSYNFKIKKTIFEKFYIKKTFFHTNKL